MNPDVTQQIQAFEHLVEKAKQDLLAKGGFPGMSFIMCQQMEVGPWLRNTVMDAETGMMVKDELIDGKGLTIIAVPCLYGDANLLLHMMKFLSDDPEKASQALGEIQAIGHMLGRERVTQDIVNTFKRLHGVEEKDIVASFLRKVCLETKAQSIVKIDEAWMRTMDKVEGESPDEAYARLEGPISEHPDRKECIQAMLETPTYRRLLMVPFTRSSTNEADPGYRQITWGKQEVLEDTVDEQRLGGRFSNLLMPPMQRKESSQT